MQEVSGCAIIGDCWEFGSRVGRVINRLRRDSFQTFETKWIITLSMDPESQTSHLPPPHVCPLSPVLLIKLADWCKPDRLPTVSAAQALNDLNTSSTRCISTGLKDLDALLQDHNPQTASEVDAFFGGISRGKVMEVWGPPGVGKTALGCVVRSQEGGFADMLTIACSWLAVLWTQVRWLFGSVSCFPDPESRGDACRSLIKRLLDKDCLLNFVA